MNVCSLQILKYYLLLLLLRGVTHLPYEITQCYLQSVATDTSERASPYPSQTGWYSVSLPRRDGRLSWPRWLGMYRDALPVSRQSPIQLITGPSVEQRWSGPTCYHYSTLADKRYSFSWTHLMGSRNDRVLRNSIRTGQYSISIWLRRTCRPTNAILPCSEFLLGHPVVCERQYTR